MGATGKCRPASAGAAIFDEAGRICLIQRADNGHWALPGGAIEDDETAAAAAVREVKEETGLEVKVVRLVGVCSNPRETAITYPDGTTRIWVSVLFECAVVGGTEKPQPDEVLKIEWRPPDSLPDPMLPGHIIRVRDAVLGREMLYR
jgi:ADP-ribose pyrophosphatase YjhB (NUDIX family)